MIFDNKRAFIYFVDVPCGMKAYIFEKPLHDDIKAYHLKRGERVTLLIKSNEQSLDDAVRECRIRHQMIDRMFENDPAGDNHIPEDPNYLNSD